MAVYTRINKKEISYINKKFNINKIFYFKGIKQGIEIGNNVVVGANSFVNKDIQNNQLGYGSPFKVVRQIEDDENYLT